MMYDNIKMALPYPFKTVADREQFCKRYGLAVIDASKGIYHNRGHQTLKQNKDVFIRMQTPKSKQKAEIVFTFSLHKFYNSYKMGKPVNYTDFTISQAKEAREMFKEFIGIDVDGAKVRKYEAGFNVQTTHSPDNYMRELKSITVKTREMRIIEDPKQREYKQFSTHKDKGKRIIYIFYNKTFEAQSKGRTPESKDNVPPNLLRVEMDYHRPATDIYFEDLFHPIFLFEAKQELYRRFVDNLQYIEYYYKQPGITSLQIEVSKMVDKYGFDGAIERHKKFKDTRLKTKRQHEYFVKQAKELEQSGLKPQKEISELSIELKNLIIRKIGEI